MPIRSYLSGEKRFDLVTVYKSPPNETRTNTATIDTATPTNEF